MSFIDGKPRIATKEDCSASWGFIKNGERFRCYLCGHKFIVGDYWRFVFMNDGTHPGCGNFLVCEKCDGEDVKERFVKANEELRNRFWWAYQ
jgi:hypothetical protein